MRLALVLAMLLTGCATSGGVQVQWKMLPYDELQQRCGARLGRTVVGCAAPGPITCQIFTLDYPPERREELHETLGHELRHCFEGKWHK